jgi:hypothetical protein
MRNIVLADRLAVTRGLAFAVVAAYADFEESPTAHKARTGQLGHPAVSGKELITPISYQEIVALARSISSDTGKWDALAEWIGRKITKIARGRQA